MDILSGAERELESKLLYVQWVEMTLVNSYGEAESNGWSEEARQILSNGDSWESWKLIWDVMCSVWALFILRYLSYITNVLITEVSALRVSTVRGQPLCCGHCQSMLPPLFRASPTLWQQLAISHLVCGLQSLSEQGLTLWHNSLPLQTKQSKRENKGSEGCLTLQALHWKRCSLWLEGRKLNAILFSKAFEQWRWWVWLNKLNDLKA